MSGQPSEILEQHDVCGEPERLLKPCLSLLLDLLNILTLFIPRPLARRLTLQLRQ